MSIGHFLLGCINLLCWCRMRSSSCPGALVHLKAMMIWQLLQVGHLQNSPLILVGEMYGELVAWCRGHMLRPDIQLANAEDIALPHSVEDGPGVLRISSCLDDAKKSLALSGCSLAVYRTSERRFDIAKPKRDGLRGHASQVRSAPHRRGGRRPRHRSELAVRCPTPHGTNA